LLRLRAETTYLVRAYALDPVGCPAEAAQAFVRTGPLPPLFERELARTAGRPSFPLVLFDYRVVDPLRRLNQAWLVAMDGQGAIVWHYELPTRMIAPPSVLNTVIVKPLSNGNLFYSSAQAGFEEITRDARSRHVYPIVDEGPNSSENVHHDFVELADGRILFLGVEQLFIANPSLGGRRTAISGDALFTLDIGSGQQQKVWSSFNNLNLLERPDHWLGATVGDNVDDWTHANSLSFGPRGNLLISFRHLDQVISLTPDLSSIEWRLGGVNSSFSFPNPDDQFFGQHTAQEIAPGRILLFDNGNHRPAGEYSRGLELQLDFDSLTARKVWEYRPSPDVFSGAIGNVRRLPKGHTLVNFGSRFDNRDLPILLVETQPDGSPVWEHWSTWRASRLGRYRAQPLDSLGGEQPIDQPRQP
jgi:hypothetical protein